MGSATAIRVPSFSMVPCQRQSAPTGDGGGTVGRGCGVGRIGADGIAVVVGAAATSISTTRPSNVVPLLACITQWARYVPGVDGATSGTEMSAFAPGSV